MGTSCVQGGALRAVAQAHVSPLAQAVAGPSVVQTIVGCLVTGFFPVPCLAVYTAAGSRRSAPPLPVANSLFA